MKGKIATMMVALVAIAFLCGCAGVPKPGVKGVAKKAATEARVEVLESEMEKIAKGLGEGYSTIKITGKAVYRPAKVGAKPFKDLTYLVSFDLLDAAGRKVTKLEGIPACGEYGQKENVVPNEPFPFVLEESMIKTDQWAVITSHKFVAWQIIQ
jgi:hypothetical protein